MKRAATFAAVGALGMLAALEPPFTRADVPRLPHGQPAHTVTVQGRYQHKDIRWWAAHAVRARRDANQQARNSLARGRTIRRLQGEARVRWSGTVDYALRLAAAAYAGPPFYGPSYSKLRAVAYCESTLSATADNGRYHGLMQLGWAPFGFSPYDPVASALSAAQTVVRDGSWRQWSCGGAG